MSIKYSPLMQEDCFLDESPVFDFSSSFKYEDPQLRFDSIFTYKPSVFTYKSYTLQDYSKNQRTTVAAKIFEWTLICFGSILLICTAPLSIWFCIKILPNHERALTFRLGRVHSVRGPGITYLLPCLETWHKTDIRIRAFSIPPQQMIALDGAILELGADVQFRVVNIPLSVLHVKNLDNCYRIIGRSLFINCLCKKTLSQIQLDRAGICKELLDKFNEVTLEWGVKIENVEISEIKILKKSEPQCVLSKLLTSFQGQSSKTSMIQKNTKSSSSQSPNKSHLFHKLSELLESLSKTGLLKGIDSNISMEIFSSNLEIFNIILKNDQTFIKTQSTSGNEDVIIRMTEHDFEKMINHELTPLEAYISGHLQVEGDLQILMRLQTAIQAIPQFSVKSTIINI